MPGLLALLAIAAIAVVVVLAAAVVRGARRPPPRTLAYAIAHGLPCDPGEVDLAFESWTLERPGGIRLPVWEARGRGEAGPITAVFVHGWGQSRVDMLVRRAPWDELAERLVLYELRGHGEAEGGPSDLGHGEEHDLLALLDRLGRGSFVLVGHSMGALIALRAAAADRADPPRIAGVAACAPYLDFHRSLQRRLRASALPARPVTDLAMAWFGLRGLRQTTVLASVARLPCPLLVMHGDADRIVPLAEGEAIAAAAPDGVLCPLPGAGHGDGHRVARDEHDRAVRAFLRRCANTEGSAADRDPVRA